MYGVCAVDQKPEYQLDCLSAINSPGSFVTILNLTRLHSVCIISRCDLQYECQMLPHTHSSVQSS